MDIAQSYHVLYHGYPKRARGDRSGLTVPHAHGAIKLKATSIGTNPGFDS